MPGGQRAGGPGFMVPGLAGTGFPAMREISTPSAAEGKQWASSLGQGRVKCGVGCPDPACLWWASRMHAKALQWCSTLCDPMDCSPPASSVHGILQARILEWVIMPSSREPSRPRIEPASFKFPAFAHMLGSLPLVQPGKPVVA